MCLLTQFSTYSTKLYFVKHFYALCILGGLNVPLELLTYNQNIPLHLQLNAIVIFRFTSNHINGIQMRHIKLPF